MKKIIVIAIVLVMTGSVSLAGNNFDFSNNQFSSIEKADASLKPDDLHTSGTITRLHVPWAKNGLAISEMVISKGDYCLYRVASDNLINIPSCEPVGTQYHYFVYKNGSFLFTVNQCNKSNVYRFFSE